MAANTNSPSLDTEGSESLDVATDIQNESERSANLASAQINCTDNPVEESPSSISVTSRPSRSAKASFISIESQKNELAFSLYASINREMRNIDKLVKFCATDDVTIDDIKTCYADIENKAEAITSDYARISQLSENKVERSIAQNFEIYAHEVEVAKSTIGQRIETLEDEEEEIKQKEEELTERMKLLAEEQRKFEEYMADRKKRQQSMQPTNTATHPTTQDIGVDSQVLPAARTLTSNTSQQLSTSRELSSTQIGQDVGATSANASITHEQFRVAGSQSNRTFSVTGKENRTSTPTGGVKNAIQHTADVESESSIKQLAHSLTQSIKQTKKMDIEPEVFNGDSLLFADWESDFDSFLESQGISDGSEKIRYLKKYVSGSAKECISGQFYIRTDDSYKHARQRLRDRFGKKLDVARVMRDKLNKWSRIHNNDSEELQKYADYLDQCRSGMQSINGLAVLDDPHINEQLADKLPDWAKRKWATKVFHTQKTEERYPSFAEFSCFVAEEAEVLSLPLLQKGSSSTKSASRIKAFATQNSKDCLHCSGLHATAHCFKLLAEPYDHRIKFMQSNLLCYSCGEGGHEKRGCSKREQENCRKCKKPGHPTILHKRKEDWQSNPGIRVQTVAQPSGMQQPILEENKNVDTTTVSVANPTEETTKLANKNTRSKTNKRLYNMGMPVYVSTAANPNHKVLVYAFMDSGADSSYITHDLADKLKPKKLTRGPVEIETMTGEAKEAQVTCYSDIVISGYFQGTARIPTAYEWPRIPNSTGEFANSVNIEDYPHLSSIVDMLPPPLDIPVGLLIGANCATATFPLESIKGAENQPYAVRSKLGWMVFGVEETTKSKIKTHHTTIIEDDTTRMSQDDYKFMEIMEKATIQTQSGSYQMPLPFKERPQLPNNRQQALKRLENLQKKLNRDENLRTEYEAYMNEITKEFAELVEEPNAGKPGEHWYIPHFAVTHPQKKKIRVVFDCKASWDGTSLNDHLLQGPDMYNSMIGILCRFRKESIAISCDIQKMFFNFFVNAEDRDYLRFLWSDHEGNTQTWRMKVHLFGACSSPAVATYGLRKIADDHSYISEKAARFIRQDFYVDDGITSVDSEEAAIDLVAEARAICQEGNLRLHKFCSNNSAVLSTIPESERAVQNIDLFTGALPEQRTLGLLWKTDQDCFRFVNNIKEKPNTRRGLLSVVSQLYDPLGFIAPFTLQGKNILQRVTNVGWDDEIPTEIKPDWDNWLQQLPAIENVSLCRCLKPKEFGVVVKMELHHFSDASENGIGACSYIRQVNEQGQCHVAFLAGKSKVIPSKGATTIPRLELRGAVAATQLSNMLRTELNMTFDSEHFWIDSEIVLGWLANSTKRFKTFVTNRTRYILSHTELSQWHHVPGHLNPADIASRGMSCEKLLQSTWFTGPAFLKESTIQLLQETNNYAQMLDQADPELKVVKTLNTTATVLLPIASRFSKFSSWLSLKRAIANLQCMAAGTKAKNEHWKKKRLTIEDINLAEEHIIKEVQSLHFHDEINSLKNDKQLNKTSALLKLDPFVDKDGILRVGGRAKLSLALSYEERHPVILPHHDSTSTLIARHYHNKVHHQGRTTTLAKIRNSGFWIVGATKIVKSLVRQCITCQRLRGTPVEQKMADLPQERLEPTPPFTHIGMDCFGPFIVKERRTELKVWGLLLTCCYSRAVHVEILKDMTSDSLINALRAVICLRGPVQSISCDRGTNFIGANNELLKELAAMDPSSTLTQYFQSAKIHFKFNTPTASHAGGLWERQIKNIKTVLKGMAAKYDRRLDTAGLRTAFYEAMATVNSRPLTVNNLNDPHSVILTPNHLLTMKAEDVITPSGNIDSTELYGRKMWRKSQQFAEQFWAEWKSFYLAEITKRQRWKNVQRNIKIGDVVLIVEEELPRNTWKTGVIEEVKAGSDGLVRSAKVRLSNKLRDKSGKEISPSTTLERPVQKLVLLQPAICN